MNSGQARECEGTPERFGSFRMPLASAGLALQLLDSNVYTQWSMSISCATQNSWLCPMHPYYQAMSSLVRIEQKPSFSNMVTAMLKAGGWIPNKLRPCPSRHSRSHPEFTFEQHLRMSRHNSRDRYAHTSIISWSLWQRATHHHRTIFFSSDVTSFVNIPVQLCGAYGQCSTAPCGLDARVVCFLRLT